jgi:hypothetical protein
MHKDHQSVPVEDPPMDPTTNPFVIDDRHAEEEAEATGEEEKAGSVTSSVSPVSSSNFIARESQGLIGEAENFAAVREEAFWSDTSCKGRTWRFLYILWTWIRALQPSIRGTIAVLITVVVQDAILSQTLDFDRATVGSTLAGIAAFHLLLFFDWVNRTAATRVVRVVDYAGVVRNTLVLDDTHALTVSHFFILLTAFLIIVYATVLSRTACIETRQTAPGGGGVILTECHYLQEILDQVPGPR